MLLNMFLLVKTPLTLPMPQQKSFSREGWSPGPPLGPNGPHKKTTQKTQSHSASEPFRVVTGRQGVMRMGLTQSEDGCH